MLTPMCLRVLRVHRVLGIDERADPATPLRLRDHVVDERRLARRLRAEDLDHPPAREAADPERQVERERAGRDRCDRVCALSLILMTDPLPNCRSIWPSATSSASSRFIFVAPPRIVPSHVMPGSITGCIGRNVNRCSDGTRVPVTRDDAHSATRPTVLAGCVPASVPSSVPTFVSSSVVSSARTRWRRGDRRPGPDPFALAGKLEAPRELPRRAGRRGSARGRPASRRCLRRARRCRSRRPPRLTPSRSRAPIRHRGRNLGRHRAVRRRSAPAGRRAAASLTLVVVGDDAAHEHVTRARDVGQTARDQPTRARLGSCEGQTRVHGTASSTSSWTVRSSRPNRCSSSGSTRACSRSRRRALPRLARRCSRRGSRNRARRSSPRRRRRRRRHRRAPSPPPTRSRRRSAGRGASGVIVPREDARSGADSSTRGHSRCSSPGGPGQDDEHAVPRVEHEPGAVPAIPSETSLRRARSPASRTPGAKSAYGRPHAARRTRARSARSWPRALRRRGDRGPRPERRARPCDHRGSGRARPRRGRRRPSYCRREALASSSVGIVADDR